MKQRIGIAVLLVLGVMAFVAFSSEEEARTARIDAVPEEGPVATEGELPPSATPSTTPSTAPSPSVPEPTEAPPVRAASARPLVSACGDGEGDRAVDRPTVSELVAVRAQELDDRVRHALRRPDASAALRDGLLAALEPAGSDRALGLLRGAPDRHVDGFDHLAAVASVLAWQALSADDPRRALSLARYAEREAPGDALPYLVEALAAEAQHDPLAARSALAEAFRLEPGEPAVALAYVRRLRDGVELDAALTAFDAYLREVPDDTQIARMRARMRLRREAMGTPTVRRLRGISLMAPSSIDRALTDRALDVTDRALSEASRLIGATRRPELSVFVYRTHREMVDATCVQEWAAALYDGALHVDGERLASSEETALSLRHEALHAALHEAVPGARRDGTPLLPTWFDEGLAQYFANEEPLGARRSFALMVREHTYVPLPSMNGQFMVIDDPRDAGLAYHQALAMVLYLIERRGERGIAEAVRYLLDGGDPDALLAGVGAPLDGETLLGFLSARIGSATLPR